MTQTQDATTRAGVQAQLRQSFDVDAFMDQLERDPRTASTAPTAAPSYQGSAGTRLRPWLVADISDVLLREFARDTLGAGRCSEQYLDALRVVLGNQAEAERMGYVLELNLRVSFAPFRVMRTIIDQMAAAKVTHGALVQLGEGKVQVVQVFHSPRGPYGSAAQELEARDRRAEVLADEAIARAQAAGKEMSSPAWDAFDRIPPADVPY